MACPDNRDQAKLSLLLFSPFFKKQPRCKLYGALNHPVRPKTVQTNQKDTPGMIRC